MTLLYYYTSDAEGTFIQRPPNTGLPAFDLLLHNQHRRLCKDPDVSKEALWTSSRAMLCVIHEVIQINYLEVLEPVRNISNDQNYDVKSSEALYNHIIHRMRECSSNAAAIDAVTSHAAVSQGFWVNRAWDLLRGAICSRRGFERPEQ